MCGYKSKKKNNRQYVGYLEGVFTVTMAVNIGFVRMFVSTIRVCRFYFFYK